MKGLNRAKPIILGSLAISLATRAYHYHDYLLAAIVLWLLLLALWEATGGRE